MGVTGPPDPPVLRQKPTKPCNGYFLRPAVTVPEYGVVSGDVEAGLIASLLKEKELFKLADVALRVVRSSYPTLLPRSPLAASSH